MQKRKRSHRGLRQRVGCGSNKTAGVTQVLVSVSICQAAIWVHLFDPQRVILLLEGCQVLEWRSQGLFILGGTQPSGPLAFLAF